MNQYKRILAGLMAVAFSMMLTLPALAAKSLSQLREDMDKSADERKRITKQIDEKQEEKDEIVAQRTVIDQQINSVLDDIENVENTIREKDEEIEARTQEINALQETIDQNKDKLKTRMRVMYEYGSVSYLELILEAKGLGDLFTRLAVIRDIVTHDQNLINTYIAARTEVEEARAVIETEKAEQVAVKAILDEKKAELQVLQDEKNKLISAINEDIETLERLEKQAEKDYNALLAELNAALGISAPVVYQGNGQFGWPSASSTRVTSEFNPKRLHPILKVIRPHNGMDIGAAAGTNVLAAEAGKVVTAGYNSSYGNYITINHGSGYVTLYAHNSKLLVKSGDTVTRGQVIAKVGSTGSSTAPHIHFEVRVNGKAVNPRNYL